jgi:hypothetical protein
MLADSGGAGKHPVRWCAHRQSELTGGVQGAVSPGWASAPATITRFQAIGRHLPCSRRALPDWELEDRRPSRRTAPVWCRSEGAAGSLREPWRWTQPTVQPNQLRGGPAARPQCCQIAEPTTHSSSPATGIQPTRAKERPLERNAFGETALSIGNVNQRPKAGARVCAQLRRRGAAPRGCPSCKVGVRVGCSLLVYPVGDHADDGRDRDANPADARDTAHLVCSHRHPRRHRRFRPLARPEDRSACPERCPELGETSLR